MVTRLQQNGAKGRRRRPPHTTVQRLLSWGLPTSWGRFLWRQPGDFPVTAFLLGAGTGGLLAIGLFQLLVNPMNIYEHQKVMVLYGLGSKESLRAETQNVSNSFKDLDAQVNSETGYAPADATGLEETAPGVGAHQAVAFRRRLSTQKMFELKTKLRCSYVVNQAILSCRRWFDHKHEQCMQRIWVPLLSHLLCLPMKFKFFCGIAKVMGVWCRSRIPVEGNFGQTYDSLNQSLGGLRGEFSATIDFKEEKRAGLLGVNTSWEHVSTGLRDYVRQQEAQLEWALGLLHALLSCTFLLVLHASFSYVDSYNGDIRFDNIYISTYFCQIDERRKKLGKRTLLPLRKAEKKAVIFPYDPTIQALEMKNLIPELLETLPVLLLLAVLCGLDWSLYSAFDAIRHHSFLQYSFRSERRSPETRPPRNSHLYNELLRKRAAFTQLRRAAIVRQAQQQRAPRHRLADILHRRCPLLRPWLRRRCVVCQAPETPESYVCQTPDCKAVYCRSCWDDMRQRCPACTPREELSSSAFSDSDDDVTYAE
ncbi:E3 ubiquitin-protein ligase DCST1 [Pteropus vampyrus]|uniref:E3 ubiquitin-protein ligase DCST1 n=1 Tax=Pteropus vampyrus TaxID=132908 RepID=A0A6P6CRY1_PTEVA|nr:E3 ubiquitin-protein ligase DCST1 [Pteropus vampyrus]